MLYSLLLIFLVRIVETMLNTFRTILIVKNNKKLAVIVAFFEISIWLFAIKKIVNNDFNIYSALAYALGFSLGTYIAMKITEKFNVDKFQVRIVLDKENNKVINYLKFNNISYKKMIVEDENEEEKMMLYLSITPKEFKSLRTSSSIIDADVEIIISGGKKV